jgi:protease PrsW
MELALSLTLAVLPALLAVTWFRRKDRARPEPRGQIVRLFLLGAVSVAPAVLIELAILRLGEGFGVPKNLLPFFKAFFVAALVEEGLKYFLLRKFVFFKPHFDEMMDGMVYAIMAGMGFACLENVLFVLGSGLTVAVMRAFTSIPMHACASAFMGYYLGRARLEKSPRTAVRLASLGFLLAFLLHGLYDAFLFGIPVWGSSVGFGILPLLVLGLIGVKRMVRRALQQDVAAGRCRTD